MSNQHIHFTLDGETPYCGCWPPPAGSAKTVEQIFMTMVPGEVTCPAERCRAGADEARELAAGASSATAGDPEL